jgi:hypothetical protein
MAAAIRLGRSRGGLRPSMCPRPFGKNRRHRSSCGHCCGWSLIPSSRDGICELEVRAVPRVARVLDIASSSPWVFCVCLRETPSVHRGDASPTRATSLAALGLFAIGSAPRIRDCSLGSLQHVRRLRLKTCYRELVPVAAETTRDTRYGDVGLLDPAQTAFRCPHLLCAF